MQDTVAIVDYAPQYREVFGSLNEAWISQYFDMEDEDRRVLYQPEEHILQPGGQIFVALLNGEPVGVCALMKMDDPEYNYELAKMAVAPQAQGKRIGLQLGQKAIAKAQALGANKLYLESNTCLAPAIKLYEKLGFRTVSGRPSPYQRVNIRMELDLSFG